MNTQNQEKNNKNLFILILIIILIFILGTGLLNYKKEKNNTEKKSEIKKNKIVNSKIKDKEKLEKLKREKLKKELNNFKETVATKWLIINWDIHLKNDEYILALKKFLEANKKTPNNPKIISKIAKTYFLMKNYSQAFKYYLKINDEKYLDENKKTLSFLYSTKIEENNFSKNWSWVLDNSWSLILNNLEKNIKNLWLDKNTEFYYSNSLECIKSFHICKLNYENYFKNSNYNPTNENLENIRIAISNYKNFKVEELYYKNTLIIWEFLKNKNYPVAILLSKELLKQKKNYKPLLKIIAQSYFELNQLDKASKYLLEYSKIDSKSPDVSYMIWVIAQKNKDYIKSNIFLNIATEQWYYDLESIYRLQLYNYLILWQKEKIAQTFDKIIVSQDKPHFNDLILWSYYNIINNNFKKAWLLTNMWIKFYPEREDFYWFKAWILIEEGKYDEAEILLDKATKINPRNALVLLNKWRIYRKKFEEDNKIFHKAKAKLFFKKANEFDSSDIWILAKKYLEEMEKEEKSVE